MKKVFGMSAGQAFGILTLLNTEKACRDNDYICTFECACGSVIECPASYVKVGGKECCGCTKKYKSIYQGEGPSKGKKQTPEYTALINLRRKGKYEKTIFEFINEFGRRPSVDHVFWNTGFCGWVKKKEIACIRDHGYFMHILRHHAYKNGLLGKTLASSTLGISMKTIENHSRRCPDAFALGKAERARREQAARAPKHTPAVVNTDVEF